MKILVISHRFIPAIGGIEKHTYLISKSLVNLGYDITHYTTNSISNDDVLSFKLSIPFLVFPKKNKTNLLQTEIVENIRVNRFNFLFRFWSFNFIPGMFLKLKNNINNFDIIHAHGYHVTSSVVACYYAKKHKKPFILTGHDLIIPDNLSGDAKILKYIYDKTVGKYLINNSSCLIALTEDNAIQYKRLGANTNKIVIIPNGIEVSKYTNKRFQNIKKEKILLFVGRIEEYKGIQDIINMIPTLIKIFPDLKLYIVGNDYGYKNELIKLIKSLYVEDYIEFFENLNETELINIFNKSDIFVFPSKMEGFGIVLLEAMASKCLSIAYPIPAVRKIIINGYNGILVNNKDELLDRTMFYLENVEEKNIIEYNATEFVKKYDIENIAIRINETYTKLYRENL